LAWDPFEREGKIEIIFFFGKVEDLNQENFWKILNPEIRV